MSPKNYILRLLHRSGELTEAEIIKECTFNLGISKQEVYSALYELEFMYMIDSVIGLNDVYWFLNEEEK